MQALKNTINKIKTNKSFPDHLLIHSQDNIRKTRILDYLIKHFQFEAVEQMNVYPQDLKSHSDFLKLKSSFVGQSLFSKDRLIIFKNFTSINDKILKSFQEIFKKKHQGVYFIFLVDDEDPKKIKKYFKKEFIVPIPTFNESQTISWAQKELKKLNLEVEENSIINGLLKISELNLDDIYQYIKNLALFTDNNKISISDFKLFKKTIHKNMELKFIDQLLAPYSLKTEYAIDNFSYSSGSLLGLLTILRRNFKAIFQIKVNKTKLQDMELSKELSLPFWLYKKHKTTANRLSIEQINKIISELVDIEKKFKNKNTGIKNLFSMFYRKIHNV